MTSKTMNFTEWMTEKGITKEEFTTAAPEHQKSLQEEFKKAFTSKKHEAMKTGHLLVEAAKNASKKGAKTMKATKKTAKKATEKKASSGARIRELILKGMANDAILVVIKKEFKDGKTTTGDVSWNRSMLKAGKFNAPKKVLTNAEALAKAEKK